MGVICVTAPTEETLPADYTYEYSPLFPTTEEGFAATMAWTPKHPVVYETSVWTVKDWGHHTVLRNPRWWVDVGYPGYQRFWKAVETARHDGIYKPKILLLERKPSTTKDGSDTAGTPRRVRDAVVEVDGATTGVDERAVGPVAETGETKSLS